ncbi:MAG: 2Fe-2S ferredoxin [Thermomicrobiales bacterium]|nr:2Fe-2S ferredoxin [Thermomicrobiales bacterium]MDF3039327.1 2Fe-2S ferredoxin [Thermomicrobiales bacterium]
MSESATSSERLRQQRWPVARASEIAPGERRLVEVKRRSIGIFNVNGEYVAVLNVCPHELAPVCRGRLGGTTLPSAPGEYQWGRDGEILACPWHGWEFDLLTGELLADPRIRLRRYPVDIEDDTIFITL